MISFDLSKALKYNVQFDLALLKIMKVAMAI